MLRDSLIRAVNDALARVGEIEERLHELAQLQAEKECLQEFCNSTSLLVERFGFGRSDTGVDNRKLTGISHSETQAIAANALIPDEQYLWKAIHVVLGLHSKPMTAQQVLDALEALHFEVSGNHKRESVRVALTRKSDIFERVDRGLFGLRTWSEDVKALATESSESGIEEPEQPILAEAV